MPFEFLLVDRRADLLIASSTTVSNSSAFAAYLMAWERMAANTHISAVFDMALGCVQDIGVPGPDADTGAGRLDIGCMAHAAAHAPSCYTGYVLTSVRDARCERFSYWEDLQAPLSIAPNRESLLVRAFKDVGITTRLVDRSANAHVAGNSTVVAKFEAMGIAASDSYTSISNTSNPASTYASLGTSDLFILPSKPAAELFTSDTSEEAGIDSSTVAAGAWMLSWVGQAGTTFDPLFGVTLTVSGNVDPLLRVTVAIRREGIKLVAATGKVHFFYGPQRRSGRPAHRFGRLHAH